MEMSEFLLTDPELIEMRKQYRELGEYMEGFNYDTYDSLAHYKQYCREKLENLKTGAPITVKIHCEPIGVRLSEESKDNIKVDEKK